MTAPSGTVTFLFTDIEGSTRMWEEHRDAMPVALDQHDRVLRTAIEGAGGYIFTTAGDAFSAAFADPRDAIAAAVAAQLALAGADWEPLEPIRVRMALHSGVAHERDGDYFGPALNRTARMLDVGHGGQVLLSRGTEELVGGALDGMSLRDLGEHTLKDLGRPEQVHQLVHPELQDEFPGLRSLNAQPNNLPVQLTSFVGRDAELVDVVKRLHDSRLLTLTGVGGSGKTRLSLQAAAESIGEYQHGVWLVELASVGDPDQIPTAIGDVLGITRSQIGTGNAEIGADAASVISQVTDHLKGRTTLLLLDNCEHVISAVARVVQHLLSSCPDLTVMATSREGLGVPGEVLWQVPSLASDIDDPLRNDAVQLFLERAADANPRFDADADSVRWVQQLCERLDGMPLAIELAAARARVLDAKQIAERLDDRFRLLTGGSRTALPRHQTLEATVDWSYELMSEPERTLFLRLAAFRGGFTLEAAEVIGSGGDVDSYDVLDLIGHLVDKSMVIREEVSGRFGMLETLRQYALRRLTESEEVAAVRSRHAEYFCNFIAESAPLLTTEHENQAYQDISDDLDNLRAAMSFGLENGLPHIAARISADLSGYWWASANLVEGLEWLHKTMPYIDDIETTFAVQTLAFASLFTGFGKNDEAQALAHDAIARARAADDPRSEALGHMALGFTAWTLSELDIAKGHMGDMLVAAERAGDPWLIGQANLWAAFSDRTMSRLDDAAERAAAAEVALRTSGQPSGLAWVLATAGQIARYRGDFEIEIEKQREARVIFEQTGSPFNIAFTLICEAIALTLAGRAQEAIVPGRRALAVSEGAALTDNLIEGVIMVGWFEIEAGNVRESHDRFREAIELSAPNFDPAMLSVAADHMVMLMVKLEHWEAAAQLHGFHETNKFRPEAPIYTTRFQPARDAYRSALGDRAPELHTRGAKMEPKQLYEMALQWLNEVEPKID